MAAGDPIVFGFNDPAQAAGFTTQQKTSAPILPDPIATYVPILSPAQTISYNADGTVSSVTVNGVTTTYTYNTDGTVATEARAGVTRTYTYINSNLTSVA